MKYAPGRMAAKKAASISPLVWALSATCHLAADQSLGRVRFGDSGQNLPHLGADVDFQSQEFVRLGHALGDLHDADTKFDLGEVVDRDFPSVRRRRGHRCRDDWRRV